ncbi:MFS transporter [Aquabacterium sp.]|uniref:MFS transporter n=1 Tax=Aquabacterium sp. TaxID=1872578 RepID=UPI003782FE6D
MADTQHDDSARAHALADWFGLNRATLAVLVVVGCLGLSEEIWSSYLSLHLADRAGSIARAVELVGVLGFAQALLEGCGYLVGGSLAHRLGARRALAVSALPPALGFALMLLVSSPWVIVAGAVLMTAWDPLSVPATFDVVGSEVPKGRRTIAFALQSIQKRLPKVIGPALGAAMFVGLGYWANVTLAFVLLGFAVAVQHSLMRRLRPKADPPALPLARLLRDMPSELRRLLAAEILIRFGEWFVRGFAALYVFDLLTHAGGWAAPAAAAMVGTLVAVGNLVALATYVPVAKWVDQSPSPRPFIGLTFVLFALFPILLVVLPRASAWLGLPLAAGLVGTYVINGLREIGEPARKALIAGGFPAETRARSVGLYWGLRSFAYAPAPLLASWLWEHAGPERTFLAGGALALVGVAWFAWRGPGRR